MLTSDLCFKVWLHVVKDGKYASINFSTGQWFRLIGELVCGKMDMTLAELTVNQGDRLFN